LTQSTLAILCWFGLMAYTLGSLYLAIFKKVIYLVPGKSWGGSMRRVSASDYPSEYRAQLIVLGVLLAALIIASLVLF